MDRMPVFVKVDEYDQVLSLLKTVRNKLDEARETLSKIHDLKNDEDHQLELWQNSLSEVVKKVDFINHSLTEPQNY